MGPEAPDRLLAAVQFADSFFPGGGVSLSWGVEPLLADGALGAASLPAFVRAQLEQRWATADAPAVAAAWQAGEDLDRLQAIDALVEACALCREWREGSRRSGAAHLRMHRQLGTAGAADYEARVRAGTAAGHLPVVQGLLWRAHGLSQQDCLVLSAYGLCVGLLGAALRLGVLGHGQAQAALLELRPACAMLAAGEPSSIEDMSSTIPATDIAALRHETQAVRLFAN